MAARCSYCVGGSSSLHQENDGYGQGGDLGDERAPTLHDREGVTLEHARDVLWAYSSAELYGLLVLRQGWPLELYGQFVAEGMIAALLPRRREREDSG